MSSSVFLSNVDDYLAPSQACVNPLFSTDKADEKSKDAASHKATTESTAAAATAAIVVPRPPRKRRGRGLLKAATPTLLPAIPSDPVQASIADCLACSGCVTTAETVLMEQQHSLVLLREMIHSNNTTDNTNPTMIVTVSPASWADILRHIGVPLDDSDSDDLALLYRQRLATLLQRTLAAACILDGNVPLQWSLQQAADEFCQAYRRAKLNATGSSTTDDSDSMDVDVSEQESWQRQLTPSMALSSLQSIYMVNGVQQTVETEQTFRNQQQLPVITSSCPAVVCLVEKSMHAAVPHLSVTKSPMAAAGAFWKQQQASSSSSSSSSASSSNNNNNNANKFFHVGIMPCHDKKLEASRKDLQDAEENKDVDMVITTSECVALMNEYYEQQQQESNNDGQTQTLREHLESLPAARVQQELSVDASSSGSEAILISSTPNTTATSSSTATATQQDIFTLGSGGYADYIFRFAAHNLFGVAIDTVPWQPVQVTGPRRATSVRVAAAAQRRRDFYQATLYQAADGSSSYSCDQTPNSRAVLSFAVAYGMQTIQRVLQPFQNGTPAITKPQSPYDYIEAMACPSGCLNGGGQVRLADRETPTETRQRVSQTQQLFTTLTGEAPLAESPLSKEQMVTSYHVVPPLEHSLGAAAGVAVKDTLW